MNKTLAIVSLLCLATQTHTSDAKKQCLKDDFTIKNIVHCCTLLNNPELHNQIVSRQDLKNTIDINLNGLKKQGATLSSIQQALFNEGINDLKYFYDSPVIYQVFIDKIALSCNKIDIWKNNGKPPKEKEEIKRELDLTIRTTKSLLEQKAPFWQIKNYVKVSPYSKATTLLAFERIIEVYNEEQLKRNNQIIK
ncbi:MAG: hypothetical protein ACJAZS_000652 [Alteromonas naphthalenivorans]|jgi:hypothetical protein